MATLSTQVVFSRDGQTVVKKIGPTRTSSNNSFQHERRDIGTSEVAVTVSADIGNARECVLINRDSINFVDIGFATGVYPLRARPDTVMKLELTPATATIYLKADTSTCEVEILIHEE